MKKYTTNKNSKWIYFYKILLITLIIYFIVFVGYIYYKRFDILNTLLIVKLFFGMLIFGWFLIFGLPLFLLYFNHRKYSKNVNFEILGDNFLYNKNNKITNFSINDINEIELWLTPPAYEDRIDWQFFGKYHFTKIIMNSGEEIFISCLVFDKTKEIFQEKLINRKKKFFPFMKENKNLN